MSQALVSILFHCFERSLISPVAHKAPIADVLISRLIIHELFLALLTRFAKDTETISEIVVIVHTLQA